MKIEIKSSYLFYLTGKKNKYLNEEMNFLFDWIIGRGFNAQEAKISLKFLQKYRNVS
jgi:hypothetical protein